MREVSKKSGRQREREGGKREEEGAGAHICGGRGMVVKSATQTLTKRGGEG